MLLPIDNSFFWSDSMAVLKSIANSKGTPALLNGIIRMVGRLAKAPVAFNTRCPILLGLPRRFASEVLMFFPAYFTNS